MQSMRQVAGDRTGEICLIEILVRRPPQRQEKQEEKKEGRKIIPIDNCRCCHVPIFNERRKHDNSAAGGGGGAPAVRYPPPHLWLHQPQTWVSLVQSQFRSAHASSPPFDKTLILTNYQNIEIFQLEYISKIFSNFSALR